jgi:hypothetical protein
MKSTSNWIGLCILIFSLQSCTKENISEFSGELAGVWYKENYSDENNQISRLEYNFKQDGNFEVLRIELENETREILGYRYRSTGNYTTKGNQLTFYDLMVYSHNDLEGPFSNLKDLMPGVSGRPYTVTYSIEKNGSELLFIYPPCGELEDCLTSTTLLKE